MRIHLNNYHYDGKHVIKTGELQLCHQKYPNISIFLIKIRYRKDKYLLQMIDKFYVNMNYVSESQLFFYFNMFLKD